MSIIIYFIILTAAYYAAEYYRTYGMAPGPFWSRVPIFGNIFAVNITQPHHTFFKWAKQYGGIYSVQMGRHYTVVLNSVELIKEACITKGAKVAYRPDMPSLERATQGFSDVGFGNGRVWRQARKLFMQSIRQTLPTFSKMREAEVKDTIAALRKKSKTGEVILLEPYTRLMVFNIIYRGVTLNPRLKSIKENELAEIIDIASEIAGVANPRDFLPGGRHLPLTSHEKHQLAQLDKRDRIVQEFLDSRKSKMDPSNPKGMLEYVIANAKGENVAMILSDIFQAGVDTSNVTLQWLIVLMCNFPEVQHKVHCELDCVIGNRPVVESDLENLPYLRAVVLECMRYKTLIPSSPRATSEDITLGGYPVPKGSQVILNVYALCHDPDLWNCPHEFRPERFLEEEKDLELLSVDEFLNVKNLKFIPFSAGRRACAGIDIAKITITFAYAALMQNFDWSSPDGAPLSEEDLVTFVARPLVPPKVIVKDHVI